MTVLIRVGTKTVASVPPFSVANLTPRGQCSLVPLDPTTKYYATQRWAGLSRAISARIRWEREARGWDQITLDQKAGLGAGSISRIESGSRGRGISVETLVSIAFALDVTLDYLVLGIPPKHSDAIPSVAVALKLAFAPPYADQEMVKLPAQWAKRVPAERTPQPHMLPPRSEPVEPHPKPAKRLPESPPPPVGTSSSPSRRRRP